MDTILSVKNVNMTYIGDYIGLVDISFDLTKGETAVFVGEKYSGKTNIARVIAGLERYQSGNILFKNKDLKLIPLKDRNMGLLFNESSFISKNTLYDNLAYPMRIREYKEEEIDKRVRYLAKLFSIEKFLDEKVSMLSKKTIEIALFSRMFVIDRDLYIIDNPFKSFSKEEKDKIYVIAKELIKDKSIIFFTDNLSEGFEFSDSVYILDHCKIVDKVNCFSRPNHLATAILQGNSEVFASLKKVGNKYFLKIMDEDIIKEDEEAFKLNLSEGENLIRCDRPISDIYVDKKVLATRREDKKIDDSNYYDLASMYNIVKIDKE